MPHPFDNTVPLLLLPSISVTKEHYTCAQLPADWLWDVKASMTLTDVKAVPSTVPLTALFDCVTGLVLGKSENNKVLHPLGQTDKAKQNLSKHHICSNQSWCFPSLYSENYTDCAGVHLLLMLQRHFTHESGLPSLSLHRGDQKWHHIGKTEYWFKFFTAAHSIPKEILNFAFPLLVCILVNLALLLTIQNGICFFNIIFSANIKQIVNNYKPPFIYMVLDPISKNLKIFIYDII